MITVKADGEYIVFKDGRFYAELDGMLAIRNDKEVIAEFSKGHWTYVRIDDNTVSTVG